MGSIWLIMSNNCGTTIVHLFVNKLIFFLTRLAQIFESLHLRYEVHLTSVFFQKIRLHQYSFFLSFYHYRFCRRDSNVGNNIDYDPNYAVSMTLPLDSCPHLHCLITTCRRNLLFRHDLQDSSRWVGSSCDRSCLLHLHVCLALWYHETASV